MLSLKMTLLLGELIVKIVDVYSLVWNDSKRISKASALVVGIVVVVVDALIVSSRCAFFNIINHYHLFRALIHVVIYSILITF